MNQLKGNIYLRDNVWYQQENVIKMGIASFVKDRDNTYITGEVERGEYIYVIEIPLDKMKSIDKCLKNYFKSYNVYKGGGTEFYNRCIIDLIEPYLRKINIVYKVLTTEEINFLNRCERLRNIPNVDKIKSIFNQLNIKNIIRQFKIKRTKNYSTTSNQLNEFLHTIHPSIHQQNVLEMIEGFFQLHNIGKIVWACGLGKALLSVLIVNLLKFKSIVVGVPGKLLQKQIKKEILKLFPNKNNILFIGGDEDDGIKSVSDKTKIMHFLNNDTDSGPKFIITTYHSCHLLVDTDITFDFKIGDEAHHLVGIETENLFGKYIDNKSVYWAIENKKITDYNILVLKNTEKEVDEIISSLKLDVINKEIFISCYMCLKSFEKYNDLTHLLMYTSTTDEAELSTKYINKILELNIVSIPKEKIYNNFLHNKNRKYLDNELDKFKNASYSIISCVKIFGEGFDLPKLNGVCVACNMKSEIRIVQYLLRPNRIDFENPNKKAYIIIPYIDSYDWEIENKSYEKVRNIISQMRNIDKNIEQKIFVSVGKKKEETIESEGDDGDENGISDQNFIFDENRSELNKIKLRLRYSKTLGSKFTEEQDEYNYIKSINLSLNIKSPEEYFNSKHIHTNFIVLPEEYFKQKGVWTNWYDFMNVDTTKFIDSKQKWINFCKEKNVQSLNDYFYLCEVHHDILPKSPEHFYNHFSSIINELGFDRNRRK